MNNIIWTDLLLDDCAFLVFRYWDRFLINIIKITLANGPPRLTVSDPFHESLGVGLKIDIWESCGARPMTLFRSRTMRVLTGYSASRINLGASVIAAQVATVCLRVVYGRLRILIKWRLRIFSFTNNPRIIFKRGKGSVVCGRCCHELVRMLLISGVIISMQRSLHKITRFKGR